jgi:hypothetical protein
MELPREIQLYIYSYLYEKWRPVWNKVMEEVKRIEIESKRLVCSGLLCKRWKLEKEIEVKICMDCGNYYRIPMYSCGVIGCSCD